MFDLIYRFDTSGHAKIVDPADALEARARLEAGNREFATITLLDEGTTNSRIVRLDAIEMTIAAGKLVPDPPSSAEVCAARRRNTSATTQVPMAK